MATVRDIIRRSVGIGQSATTEEVVYRGRGGSTLTRRVPRPATSAPPPVQQFKGTVPLYDGAAGTVTALRGGRSVRDAVRASVGLAPEKSAPQQNQVRQSQAQPFTDDIARSVADAVARAIAPVVNSLAGAVNQRLQQQAQQVQRSQQAQQPQGRVFHPTLNPQHHIPPAGQVLRAQQLQQPSAVIIHQEGTPNAQVTAWLNQRSCDRVPGVPMATLPSEVLFRPSSGGASVRSVVRRSMGLDPF